MLGTKGKALLLSLALLLAAGCAAKPAETVDMSTRLADSGIAEKKTTYQTVTVEKQDMVRTLNMTGDVTYRLVRPVRTGNSQLILKEILVERNQEVKTGDPVVVLQGIGSASDIRQRELEIQAQRANLEERLAWYEEQIEKIRDQAAYTRVRREIRDKQAESMEIDRDLYVLQTENRLKSLETALEEMKAAAGEIVLTAPVDGFVRSVNSRYKTGEVIPAGTELCSINGADSILLMGTSASGCYVFGRELSVTVGRGDKAKQVTGTIVSSPEVVPSRYRGSNIFVRVDPSALTGKNTQSAMEVNCLMLRDALVIPKTAISSEEGVYYVTILEGDTPKKRPVLRGPATGTMVVILQGLKEGDQVVVSSYNT